MFHDPSGHNAPPIGLLSRLWGKLSPFSSPACAPAEAAGEAPAEARRAERPAPAPAASLAAISAASRRSCRASRTRSPVRACGRAARSRTGRSWRRCKSAARPGAGAVVLRRRRCAHVGRPGFGKGRGGGRLRSSFLLPRRERVPFPRVSCAGAPARAGARFAAARFARLIARARRRTHVSRRLLTGFQKLAPLGRAAPGDAGPESASLGTIISHSAKCQVTRLK